LVAIKLAESLNIEILIRSVDNPNTQQIPEYTKDKYNGRIIKRKFLLRSQGGNSKRNRLSRDLCRLNSDKRAEQQDRLHIGIQEKIPV
jgi:hypothetical protein